MLAGSLVDGRYEVKDRLGTGGMADVFRAHDVVLDRPVALKVFRSPEADRARVEQETKLLGRLHHPHVVRLLDGGELDGVAYLALELADGPSLADRLASGPVPPDDVVGIGVALASALAYLHGKGIVHRDVKPSNVLTTADDRVVLGDLGIARMHDAAALTATGFTIGTAAYLAPEQLQGSPVGADADVYALGLVLAECLTGQRVFAGGVEEAAFARLARDPDFRDVPDPAWRSLLEAMTARDPSVRITAADAEAKLTRLAARRDDATELLAAPMMETAVVPLAAVPVTESLVTESLVTEVPLAAPAANPDQARVRRMLVACIVVPLVLLALAALTVSGAGSSDLVSPTTAPPSTSVPTTAPPPTTTTIAPPTTTAAPTPAPAAPAQEDHDKGDKREPKKR